jgi:RNA polymerase sigma-70 factor (ECF subfamily)
MDLDGELALFVANGDMTGALRLLMSDQGAAVYRFCRETLRDATLADDVQQQVFIEAFRDLPKFDRRAKVRTWLFGIARHRVLDAAKARKRARAHIEDGDATRVADPQPSLDESLDAQRLHRALTACIDELPERVRAAVLLHYQQGFSFEDMARMSDERAGTLQARVARAKLTLHTCIERQMGGAL